MSNEVVKVGGDAPSWLKQYQEDDKSLDHVKQYRKLSRIKLVQGLSPKELKKEHGEGAALLWPGNLCLVKAEEGFFDFVPLFSFTEFCLWSDRDDKSSDMILDRSFDPDGELAANARSKECRKEKYTVGETEYERRYVEHICFPGVIYGGDLADTPVTLSFEKGSFWKGEEFSTALLMRKMGGEPVPMWSQVWRFRTGTTQNRSGDEYWILNFETPDQAYITEEESAGFKKLHEDLRKKYIDREIEVDRSDADEEVVNLENESGM